MLPLLAIDIAELSWEMQRDRVLRHRVLNTYRQKAIEMTLRRVELTDIAPEFQDVAEIYTINNALIWRRRCAQYRSGPSIVRPGSTFYQHGGVRSGARDPPY